MLSSLGVGQRVRFSAGAAVWSAAGGDFLLAGKAALRSLFAGIAQA